MQHLVKKYFRILVFNSYLFDFKRYIKVCNLKRVMPKRDKLQRAVILLSHRLITTTRHGSYSHSRS